MIDLSRMRLGELLATLGALALAVCTFLPWYRTPAGGLTAWNTFGASDVLIVIAVLGGLVLAFTTLTERSVALPVASAVWSTLAATIATIAVLSKLLDSPAHSSLRAAAWISLVAVLAILTGSWQTLRDERTDRYSPAEPEARPAPSAAPESS